MNIPKAYISGFLKAIKLPRMLFILYFANFFTALVLALTFKGAIQNSFGQSAILSKLISDFDFTAISDMLYNHGDAITAVLGGIIWLVIAYYLLTTFLTGGIIVTFTNDRFTTSSFFGGAAYNFFRFLGLNLIMLLVQAVFLLLVYIPLFLVLQKVSDNMTSEITLYYIAIGGFVFHLLIFLIISMIGDYAKFYLVLNNSFNVFKGFWNGVKYVFGNFFKTYLLYLILLFLPAVIMYGYLYLERDIKMAMGVGILIAFALQQAFILMRVFLRTWVLASQYKIYNDDYIRPTKTVAIEFSVLDTKTNTETQIIEEPAEKNVTEPPKIIVQVPVKQESTQAKVEDKKEYAIDFSKTFTSINEEEHSNENIITEAEMLKKVSEEEETLLKENTVVENSQSKINNEAPVVEEISHIPVDDESGTVETQNTASAEEIQNQAIEKVEQNITIVEDESGVSENIGLEEDLTIEENQIPTIEKVDQNVINVEDESETVADKEKEKKSKNDIIEFEL